MSTAIVDLVLVHRFQVLHVRRLRQEKDSRKQNKSPQDLEADWNAPWRRIAEIMGCKIKYVAQENADHEGT